jgi:beta-glucanase (GH16 family)
MEFQTLKKSSRFKEYFKYKASRDYVNFTLLIGSEKINTYETLQKEIQSDAFRSKKEYLLLPGKKKLELSEEYKLEQQYINIKNSEKIQWFLKVRNSNKYDEVKRWELTFEEDFNADKLDKKTWLSRYFWGEVLLSDSYSLDHEKQFMNDDKNIALADSKLRIITKQEKVQGKAWNPAIGFFPRDFEYTSGVINTGCSFRQQYGLFEAKIKFGKSFPVHHALWLVSDLLLPHIDIAKASKKIIMANYWGSPDGKSNVGKNEAGVSLNRYGNGYYVFTLEWTADRLTWKINGVTVQSVTEGVPKIPMYLNISSSLYSDAKNNGLPALLEVDWVRCYKQV